MSPRVSVKPPWGIERHTAYRIGTKALRRWLARIRPVGRKRYGALTQEAASLSRRRITIALVLVALRQFQITVPAWVQQVGWIVLVAVVVIIAIRFVMSL